MPRSIQAVKFVTLILDGASTAIARRGFAAAAEGGAAVKTGAVRSGTALKRTGEEKLKSVEKVSWGPDPKTGYYRPENATAEIDVAELRAALLKHSN
ncbi:indole-3-acetic acid-induced protein ARG2-like [Punica granatum]|uniref:Indole-3-acetic acid-induced protein ARG2-like n=1 Tax=Punica granatum TaxID=22663 RepID=A0A218X4F2_PUNGR|nr:indole-3-acetic acid-induced protein ARG2-like [Punica granatum]XP_031407813.1 indole-3-acetic acid-induced protein ARG2-like [Punica granatum]OWM80105.1 hypothetical protein CDL15_Pgr010083 [Punica granatum]